MAMSGGGGDGLLCGHVRHWAGDSFLLNWVLVAISAGIFAASLSSYTFYKLYWPTQVTFEKWCRKSNPKFPTPEKVRDEVIQAVKAMWCAALCPALAFWLYAKGDVAPIRQYGFCGTMPEHGWRYDLYTFILFWIVSDFWELAYHHIGHRFRCLWKQQLHSSPTPFAVIADEFADHFCRALPSVLFPFVLPTNLDVLYSAFIALFYWRGGVYQHCGSELQWDQMAGLEYKGHCSCPKFSLAKGWRTREQWDQVVVPDYTQLLSPSFWLRGEVLTVHAGTSAASKESRSKECVAT